MGRNELTLSLPNTLTLSLPNFFLTAGSFLPAATNLCSYNTATLACKFGSERVNVFGSERVNCDGVLDIYIPILCMFSEHVNDECCSDELW